MDYYHHLLSIIADFSIFGYLTVGLLAFLESLAFVGLIIPGAAAVIVGGFLAAHGILDIGDLFLFAAVGAILGDSLSFYLGRKGIISFREENRVFRPGLLEKGKAYFEKYGSKSIFLGRFMGWVRPIIPFVAGLFGLDRKVFLLWNVSGGLLWAALHIALGYLLGQTWQMIVLWSTRASLFVIVFVVFLAAIYLLKWAIIKKGRQFFFVLASVWRSVRTAVAENPDVKRFVSRHRRLLGFLKNRLDKSKLSGLPATFLVLAFLYASFLLAGTVGSIVGSDIVLSADIRVANMLAIFRSAGLTRFFFWVTLLGKWESVLVFSVSATAIFIIWKKKSYIAPLLLSVVGSGIFTYAGKLVFHRARPSVAIYLENSYSFPSGHATVAVALYGFLAYFLIRNFRQRKSKINAFFAGLLAVAIIGFSRLYLGVHYVSDVWGGYLSGAIWLIIAISLSEYFLSKKEKNKPSPNARKRLVTAGIFIFSLMFYVAFAFAYRMPAAVPEQKVSSAVTGDMMSVFSQDQLKYTETLSGARQEPISFVIVARDDRQLADLFGLAGWDRADGVSIYSIARLAAAAWQKDPYPQAPMTPDFWNAKVHDFGFEKSTDSNNARIRHHARFWKTGYVTEGGSNIYVGTASFDEGIKWGITHKIKPDIDTERKFLFDNLESTGLIANFSQQQFVDPVLGSNFSGDPFFTDGEIYFLFAKEQ